MAQIKLRTAVSEPLKGEDAERLIAYVDNPTVPAGHDEYLSRSDETYSAIKPRQANEPS